MPLCAGWLVSGYWGPGGRLAGGTVASCEWVAGTRSFTVCLTDGQRLQLCQIRSVAKTSENGEVVAAWSTERHGISGDESLKTASEN